MLTAFQCATGAFVTEDGELLCEQCFQSEDVYARPVSNYELDERQGEEGQDYEWPEKYELPEDEQADDHEECSPALFDMNGHELREAYHYHPDQS